MTTTTTIATTTTTTTIAIAIATTTTTTTYIATTTRIADTDAPSVTFWMAQVSKRDALQAGLSADQTTSQ